MKILVLSCDKYADLFEPFHYCMEKYWPNHPEIIYSMESIPNPYYKTICINYPNEKWTKRIYETVKNWTDDYIITLCDDVFIRKPVNQARLDYLYEAVKTLKDFCQISFISEIKYHPDLILKPVDGYENISVRLRDSWKNSVNASLWKLDNFKKVLKGNTGKDVDIWKFECDKTRMFNFKYYNSTNADWPINWGRERGRRCVAVQKGKWTQECVDFFNSENYYIDFNKRGIIKGDLY